MHTFVQLANVEPVGEPLCQLRQMRRLVYADMYRECQAMTMDGKVYAQPCRLVSSPNNHLFIKRSAMSRWQPFVDAVSTQ